MCRMLSTSCLQQQQRQLCPSFTRVFTPAKLAAAPQISLGLSHTFTHTRHSTRGEANGLHLERSSTVGWNAGRGWKTVSPLETSERLCLVLRPSAGGRRAALARLSSHSMTSSG